MGSSDTGRPAVGGTFASALRGTANLTLNTWSHLAGTYDGVTIRVYVNGVQVASRAQSGLIQTSTGALTFGGDARYGQYFAGRMDEVRIYNRALSVAEIQSDMNAPVGSSSVPAPASTSDALRIGAVLVLEQGTVILTISGGPSQGYAIEASDDLLHWVPIAVRDGVAGEVTLSEPTSSGARFYRVAVAPGPSH